MIVLKNKNTKEWLATIYIEKNKPIINYDEDNIEIEE